MYPRKHEKYEKKYEKVKRNSSSSKSKPQPLPNLFSSLLFSSSLHLLHQNHPFYSTFFSFIHNLPHQSLILPTPNKSHSLTYFLITYRSCKYRSNFFSKLEVYFLVALKELKNYGKENKINGFFFLNLNYRCKTKRVSISKRKLLKREKASETIKIIKIN